MKKFIRNIAILTFLLIAFALVLQLSASDNSRSTEYLAALTDKHQRAASIQSPRILLAGGSNLVFGINSQHIEKAFGMPVVNLGLHAKLGLKFMLNELRDIARKGDIIVLSIEHSVTTNGNLELQQMTAYYNPVAYPYYTDSKHNIVTSLKRKIENHHSLFKNTVSNYIEKVKDDAVYTRNGLNAYGDGIKHLSLPSHEVLGSRAIIKEDRSSEIALLNDFYDFVQEKKMRVVFSYGAYERTEFQKNKVALQKIHAALQSQLTIEMVGALEDFVYPTDHFFDSVYHLNKKGQALHTQNLIQKLKKSTPFQHMIY